MEKTLVEKWDGVLSKTNAPVVSEDKKVAVARMLENQAMWNEANRTALNSLTEAAPENNAGAGMNSADTGNIKGYDPILISMLRRAAPQMIAFDVCGVQPMNQPTGLIFAMKARYGDGDTNLTDDVEALFDEAVTDFSGKGTHAGGDAAVLAQSTPGTYTSGTALTTAEGEALGNGTTWGTMGMTIDKVAVSAGTRGLRADYSHELQTDLRNVHGLDAEKELGNILSTEMLAEVNREVIRDLYSISELGAATTTTAGTFDLDTDSNGRWAVEKFKGMIFQIEREANQIAINTRRGKGNILICSQDIASALSLAGLLDHNPALEAVTKLNVDVSSGTFAGMLNGRIKVYVDPYLTGGSGADFAVVGYKGATQYDAGYFYAPYVPLEMFKAQGENDFQPRIAFKTRYGKVTNPYANRSGTPGAITANVNKYYRKFRVTNIL